MSVVENLERELEELGEKASKSTLAATALALARELDDLAAEQECEECGHVQSWTPKPNSLTSKSLAAKAMIDVLRELLALAPPKKEKSKRDELAERRAERRATGVAGSARQKRS